MSVLLVGNKYLFDANLDLIATAVPIFNRIVNTNKHVILCVKVKSDEEQYKVEKYCADCFKNLAQHHIICFEYDYSVYSISRQFGPYMVFHVEQSTCEYLKKFIPSFVIDKDLESYFV